MGETGSGPFAGVRVVDLSRALAGPYATLMLADGGADVIKVERPEMGDDSRGWGPPFVGPEDDLQSVYFLSVNRSKRSIVLDLKSPEGLRSLHKLLGEADVLVENFRPGVMARLGLDRKSLEQRHPHLVTLSITGFGEGGPDGDRAGFDQIVQGEAGLMGITGHGADNPTKMGVPIADILAGMFGAHGVAAALYERERTGRGQSVTTSLLASAVAIHTFQGARWTVAGEVPRPNGNHHPLIAPYGSFRCEDGDLNIAVGSEGLWARFAPLIGLDPEDPRYASNRDRVAHRDELTDDIEGALAAGGTETWMDCLATAGVPAGRIRSMDQVYDWDQVGHLGLVAEVDHPVLGPLRLPGGAVAWSRSGRAAPGAPPLLGADTKDVLDGLPAAGGPTMSVKE